MSSAPLSSSLPTPQVAHAKPAKGSVADRISALDGVRGIAILSVMVHHFVHGMNTGTALEKSAYRFADAGYAGVDLFFVLSGFLITRILLRAKESPRYFTNFFARRTVRIFPLYYLMLIVLFVVAPAFLGRPQTDADTHQVWYWVYLSNWAFVFQPSVDWEATHLWSLAIEEQFYLVWPLTVWLLSHRALNRVCLFGMATALSLRIACVWMPNGATAAYMLTPMRADTLLMGALVAIAMADNLITPAILHRCRQGAIAAAFALLVVFAALRGLPRYSPIVYTLGYWLIDVLCATSMVLILHSAPGSFAQRFLNASPLRAMGTLSYALYIVHPFIDGWLRSEFPNLAGHGLMRHTAHVLLATVVSIIAAAISWNAFEKHWLKLKRWFETANSTVANFPAASTNSRTL